MNVEIGTETLIFLFWEYLFQIFGILSLQCDVGYNLMQASDAGSIGKVADFECRVTEVSDASSSVKVADWVSSITGV